MQTGKIALKTVEEFMEDYVGRYNPLMPSFLVGNSQSYDLKVAQHTLKRLEAIGDIRGKPVSPKDTVLEQILSKEKQKFYKRYPIINQYRQSELQDPEGINDVVKQVLDEYWRHQDELFLYGGVASNASPSTVHNNGLFLSTDDNFTLRSSQEMASTGGHLPALHTEVMAEAEVANQVAGRKVVLFYGDTAIAKLNSIWSSQAVSFISTLRDALGEGYDIMKMPSDIKPASENGFLIVNLDQIKVHHQPLPELWKQGVNDEFGYTWHNFAMGSCMVDVLAGSGIIRQPLTFAQ